VIEFDDHINKSSISSSESGSDKSDLSHNSAGESSDEEHKVKS